MSNPHDAYVREMLALDGVAEDVVRLALPESVAAGLNLRSLKQVYLDLGDDRLSSRIETDFVFQLKRRKRGHALIYVVLEHQSSVDSAMPFRMLRYRVRLWEAWRAQHPRARKWPAIIPVVLYHGRRRWSAPRGFSAMVDPGDGITDVSAAYHLLDLSQWSEDRFSSLEARPATALMVRLLFDIWGATPMHRWLEARDPYLQRVMAPGGEPRAAELSLVYLMRARENVDLPKVRRVLSRYPRLEEKMVSFAEKLERAALEKGREEGRVEGREKGREEGRVEGREVGRAEGLGEGQRQALLELVDAKFGTPDAETHARVEIASAEELKTWLRRIVTADSLSAVFEG